MTLSMALVLMVVTAGTASAQWGGMSEQQLQQAAQSYRGEARCGDFWVSYAFSRVTAGGIAMGDRCEIRNYNNGRWSSLTELINLMECYLAKGFPCGDIELAQSFQAGRGYLRVISVVNGRGIGYMDIGADNRVIGHNGGQIVAAGAGNMVAAGGGNMVAAGGGNMVAAGGGNLIGNDAGSLLPAQTAGIIRSLPPANAAGYRLMSTNWVPLGNATVPRTRGKDDKVQDLSRNMLNLNVDLPPDEAKKSVPVKR